MLTLKLSSTGNKLPRMSTILATCANALIAKGYSLCYSKDMHSLLIKESDLPFLPRQDPGSQFRTAFNSAIKAWHDYEEDRKAQLLEDQGGKDGS